MITYLRNNRFVLTCTVLIICCCLTISAKIVFEFIPNQISFNKIKDIELPFHNAKDELVRHQNYTLIYSEADEQAKWVAYRLTSAMLVKTAARKNNFRVDPLVSTGSSAPSDYSKSGFDKGHLCPAGDQTFSAEAMSETFFMSNMSPQKPQFNRGIWKKLEEQVRDWTNKNEELFVVTGGVLEKNLPKIGLISKVSVPRKYYKVIIDLKEPELKSIAFLFPNDKSELPLSYFAVTIDSVEKVTGLDFFYLLPDSIEKKLENAVQTAKWGF